MADKAFAESIAGLLNSERFSDVTIICGGRRLHAHQNIICTQSDFFARAYEGPFKTGVVNLEDDELEAVLAVLSFLYTKDYNDSSDSGWFAPLMLSVKVFALAEKYLINPLLHVAADKFRMTLETKYVEDDFAEAVEEWTAITTDKNKILGNIIVETIIARKKDLLSPHKKDSRFRDMMNRIPWLAAEIAMMLISKARPSDRVLVFACPGAGAYSCGHRFAANIEEINDFGYDCDYCGGYVTVNANSHRPRKGWETYDIVAFEEI